MLWTKRFVVLLVGLAVTWDAWRALNGVPGDTISEVIWHYRSPAVAFAVGFVCGHLFWQRKR